MDTKNIILVLSLITQITPAAFWAEPMHSSGLFAVLAKAVIDDKVTFGVNLTFSVD
jgi:importin-11